VSELHEKIKRVLALGPPLRLAILFGSRARGSARPDSDVDIAILPSDPTLPLSAENLLAADLERAFGASVDLVRLDGVEGALAWRIARDGVVLLSTPPWEGARFRARAGIAHDEQRELEFDAMRRYRARLAGARS
jgi:predicted nucleotidyltransferase